jgi:acyl-coenzyme A synthetase/AMP-(fatty) acid ligase
MVFPSASAAPPPSVTIAEDDDDNEDDEEDFWSVASNGDNDDDLEGGFTFPPPPSYAVGGDLGPLENVLPGISVAVRGCVPALRRHAVERPHAPALTWLTQSGKVGATLTYAALNDAAAAASRTKPLANLDAGDRVIIAHPPGLEFSVAVHACMKAQVVFCPVYPPREGADSARLLASARDSGAKHALTTASALRTMRLAALASTGMSEVLRMLRWHACPHGSYVTRFTPTPDPPLTDPLSSEVAMLQYTSGSTGDAKGVNPNP